MIKLLKGRDIHIIACERSFSSQKRVSIMGVRWASRPDIGFPDKGYDIFRLTAESRDGVWEHVGNFSLPRTESWAIFKEDAESRNRHGGPYFDSIDENNLGFLLPLIDLVNPATREDRMNGLVRNAVSFFGNIHLQDPELSWNIWGHTSPEPLHDLLAGPHRDELIRFYKNKAFGFLVGICYRFEYATLLGFGTNDLTRDHTVYKVVGNWKNYHGESETELKVATLKCDLQPPSTLKVTRAPGVIPHPAYNFFEAWTPPDLFRSTDSYGTPLPTVSMIPKVPVAFSSLQWAQPPKEVNIIGYEPVVYLLERFAHGPDTADAPEAPAPDGAVFTPVVEGELIHDTGYEDRPGMLWPPLEGYYHYRVRSINLLGMISPGSIIKAIRHHDDLTTAAPGMKLMSAPVLTLEDGANNLTVPLEIIWSSAQDFISPDVVEFRITMEWTQLDAFPVTITNVRDADLLHADLTAENLPGPPDRFAGTKLTLPYKEYPIISHGAGANAAMRIRKVGTQMPTAGTEGVIFGIGGAGQKIRIARFERRPMVVVSISSIELNERSITLEFMSINGQAIPADVRATIYIFVFRLTLMAVRQENGTFIIEAVTEDENGYALWQAWRARPDARELVINSPAIIFPPHKVEVNVPVPEGFPGGQLSILASASDGKGYVNSPALEAMSDDLRNLKGNESVFTEAIISVYSDKPPVTPAVIPYDPLNPLWAKAAANYAEYSTFIFQWPRAEGAIRYEVWRIMEDAIKESGTTPSDEELTELALENGEKFELRSDQVFGNRFQDKIPGMAPTRVFYRIRSVNISGVKSDPSDLIGPVNIPDIRRPLQPTLKVRAMRPEDRENALKLEWTQSNPLINIRFDIYCSEHNGEPEIYRKVHTVEKGSAPMEGRRFHFIHADLVPGKKYSYHVVAIRESKIKNPSGPGTTLIEIASSPSNSETEIPLTNQPLPRPSEFLAGYDQGANVVTLKWLPNPLYQRVEVYRRKKEKCAYQLVTKLNGDAVSFEDSPPAGNTWIYQIRVYSASRISTSDDSNEIEVP